MQKYVCAIGGINLDIKGISDIQNKKADSHQGKIYFTPGGVARNVADNLARLGVPVYLLGCVGDDENGKLIVSESSKNRVNAENILTEKINTPVYLSISDNEGNLISAVNDMKDALNFISVNYLKEKEDLIKKSKIIFADTNLNKDALQFIVAVAAENKIPVYIDTVSIEKSDKVKAFGTTIDYISPNINEYENIFDSFDVDRINRQIDTPKFSKFKSIILKRGDKGIAFIDVKNNNVKFFKAMQLEAVEPNGAGDAFNAGFIYGIMNNYDEYDSIQLGICSAYFALKSFRSVSEKLTQENLLQIFKRKTQNEF